MTQNIVTRFAPSPTGWLHLGHAWSALLSHDLARAAGGRFLLRVEDIDQTRCRPEFVQGICEDLDWLGLGWDGDIRVQSDHLDFYAGVLDRLVGMGVAYQCWCTRSEIMRSAGAPQGDEGPIYPGTCKGRVYPGDGRPACWRLDVVKAMTLVGPLTWDDAKAGRIDARPDLLGDVVIARKDAATSYHLAVTVDDALQGVTDIVRGRDLFSATHIHRLLQALLDLPVPRYNHHSLIVGGDGERLAKRRQSPTLAALRDAGADPNALVEGMRNRVFPIGFALEAA